MCNSGLGSQSWFKTIIQLMNLQTYGPRIGAFLWLIWPVWLDQVFKRRNEKRFREIIRIKLLVSAQANLQTILFNYTRCLCGRDEQMSLHLGSR